MLARGTVCPVNSCWAVEVGQGCCGAHTITCALWVEGAPGGAVPRWCKAARGWEEEDWLLYAGSGMQAERRPGMQGLTAADGGTHKNLFILLSLQTDGHAASLRNDVTGVVTWTSVERGGVLDRSCVAVRPRPQSLRYCVRTTSEL